MYSVIIGNRYGSIYLKKHNNTIRKRFLKSKKKIKITLNNIIRIGLIICIEDPKEAPSINYVYIKKDTKVEKTTIADITTTSYPVKSNAMSAIN